MTSIHTLDKAASINEVQLGQPISQSVVSNSRADFALLLAMFSPNVTETANISISTFETQSDTQVDVSIANSHTPTTSTDEAFIRGEANTLQFHKGGLQSAKLMDALRPEAVIELEDTTFALGEDVYQNLSGHERRMLSSTKPTVVKNDLYDQILNNWRDSHTSHGFM